MKGLIRFLIRHQILFLFLSFELLSFYFIVNYNDKQKSAFVNSTNLVYTSLYTRYSNIANYFSLSETNDKLATKNSYLLSLAKVNYKKNYISLKEINDSLYKQEYVIFEAKVINNSVNKENNFLTIDKGYNQGVEKGDAVISTNGIVGIIKDVSPNFSTILSLLNTDVYISAKIKKNNYFGSIHWDNYDISTVKLKEISYNVNLAIGDTVITSGYSSIFPENIAIGKISDFHKIEGDNFYDIDVTLFNDFRNIKYVYIVKNLLKKEQKELEQKNNG